ncbi:MAG: pantetheine-phosphate adenylyltransferase [Deltaproteobacteria bacterium]|nr:pantetheine-phosphate adenylyltransferase [Deltaproteobacteria bacterium]MCL5276420.1 pantetheine-phosphate adenylyltransferase [Deltaproteobacteria bacterium]
MANNRVDNAVIYPGSFDPITYGHINIIERALKIFRKVIVAVSHNQSGKKPFFSIEERVSIIKEIFRKEKRVVVEPFKGLLVDYIKSKSVDTVLRGLRTVADFEFELQMSLANKKMSGNVETVFMMTEGRYSFLSSSIIKEILSLGGRAEELVPDVVVRRFNERLKERKTDIVSWE